MNAMNQSNQSGKMTTASLIHGSGLNATFAMNPFATLAQTLMITVVASVLLACKIQI